MKQNLTEAEVIELLDERYTFIQPGTNADRYVRASHVRSTQALAVRGGRRIADYLAIDKFGSAQALHGHEIKTSRSDWLTELRDPSKASAWSQHCNYWWLVVPDENIVASGELPDGWGLMTRQKTGRRAGLLRVKKRAEFRQRPPLDLDVVAGITDAAAVKRAREIASFRPAIESAGQWVNDRGAVMPVEPKTPWDIVTGAHDVHVRYHGLHKLPPLLYGPAVQCPDCNDAWKML